MSACSISLCPWKYNLASSSHCLFKTFSQRSHPNSEPCFLSFRFTTHYPSRVEETVFREEWERDLERDSERWREGKIGVKAGVNQERQRRREWMSDCKRERESVASLWTWPLPVLLMNGEEREWRETRPDKTVFVVARQERERERNRFMSHRKSPRFVVSHSPPLPDSAACSGF